MSRAHRGLLACLGTLLLCAGRDARAEVVWHGAVCGTSTASRATTRDSQAPRVDIDVVQQGAGWAATLTARYLNGATGTRYITAASCAELERAVAVSLSLLEPAGAAPDTRREPSVTPSNTTPAKAAAGRASSKSAAAGVPPVDAVVSPELAPRVPARNGFVRLAALVGTGGGRFAELGAALSGGLWLGRWGGRAEVGARRPPSSISAEHAVSLELTRLAAAVELCGRSGMRLGWGLCAGPRLELVSGLASGPSNPGSDAVVLPGVGAGVFFRIPIASSWALSSELQGSWALRGAEASVAPWGRVYELPRLALALVLGVQWEL